MFCLCLPSEVHPLLGVKGDGKSKKKAAGRPKGSKGKDKDFPFRPKPYRGERPTFPVEALGSSGPGVGGGGGVGMKGRAEGGLATGKNASAPDTAESGSSASSAALLKPQLPNLLPNCMPPSPFLYCFHLTSLLQPHSLETETTLKATACRSE